MIRRTKILATLGPSTDEPDTLKGILDAGVNVVRINFSHNNEKEHLARIAQIRQYEEENDVFIGLMMDLQGPKIRIASFKSEKIELKKGDQFTLDAGLAEDAGDQKSVGLAYKQLPNDLSMGNTLLLDDGKIILQVEQISGKKIKTQVIQGGLLSNNKGINLRGGGLSASALTAKDKKDIITAAKADADYVAISFPVNADDVRETKRLLAEAGSNASVIAKIERAESLEDDVITEIIQESAGIMVARGDLGVEIGDPQLPAQQKRLILLARANDRFVITATQMLESMIVNPIPTRAEVFDVANAVIDGTDAVMLSSETAMGDHPVEAVEAMSRICEGSEGQSPITSKTSNYSIENKKVDRAIAMACMLTADNLNPVAIAAITESGSTALWMSRINHSVPIFALTTHTGTLRKITLYRGVYPARIKTIDTNHATVNKDAVNVLTKLNVAKDNDLVIITKGDLAGIEGGTNAIKVVRVGHLVED